MPVRRPSRARSRFQPAGPAAARQLGAYRPAGCEVLESKALLTTTIFLDFGQGLGAGGSFTTTAEEFRTVAGDGGGLGEGTGSTLAGRAGIEDDTELTFQALRYDWDGNGVFEDADIDALSAAVVPLVEQAFLPFDIDVVVGTATSLFDVAAALAANNGDPRGEHDAYNFVTEVFADFDGDLRSVGDIAGLFGVAARTDLFLQQGNMTDEATLTFADNIFDATEGTPGTDAFNDNLAQRLAYTASHEAFHTFTGRHTTGLAAGGDVIRLGSETREDRFRVTRFPLELAEVEGAFVNNYDLLATDDDIGLRDDDRDGDVDFAYVTGTGAYDTIEIVRTGADAARVTVTAYEDPFDLDNPDRTPADPPEEGENRVIGRFTYSIDLASSIDRTDDTEGLIFVDGGVGSDLIIIDARIAASFRVLGGTGFTVLEEDEPNKDPDEGPIEPDIIEFDVVRVVSNGEPGVIDPDERTVTLPGGRTITVEEAERFETVGFPETPVAEITGEFGQQPDGEFGGEFVEGSPITFTATAFDSGTFAGGAGEPLEYEWTVVRTGGFFADEVVASATGTDLTTFTFTPEDDSEPFFRDYEVRLTVRNADGEAGSDVREFQVRNLPPALTLTAGDGGATVTIDEGGVATLRGTFTDPGAGDTHTLRVDWGDDSPVEFLPVTAGVPFTLTHAYADDSPAGGYAATVTVFDDENAADAATVPVFVNNLAPGVTFALSDDAITEDDVVSLAGAVTDAGLADTTEFVVVDWGDGRTERVRVAAGGTFAASHRYLDEGEDGDGRVTVTVTATDDDGGVGTASETLTVSNAPPRILSLLDNSTLIAGPGGGGRIFFAGAYRDAGRGDSHTAVVDWGDGTGEQEFVPFNGRFNIDHVYDEPGEYEVTVTLFDDDGASDTATATALVRSAGVVTEDGGRTLVVFGTDGDDDIRVSERGGSLRVVMNGEVLGDFNPDRVRVDAGAGDDRVVVAGDVRRSAVLIGGAGDDVLKGGAGNDTLLGGAGADRLLALKGDNELFGGAGGDVLRTGGGNDRLSGGDGNDLLAGRAGDDALFGQGGADRLNGGDGDDAVDGGAGDDAVNGLGGNDVLVGGTGADVVRGQAGDDVLIAGGLALPDSETRGGTAVEAAARVWTQDVDRDRRARRLANLLRGGRAAGNDGETDRLTGGAGDDLAVAQAGDRARRADALFADADAVFV